MKLRGSFNKHLIIFIGFCLAGIYIVRTAAKTMFSEASYWNAVKDQFTADSLSIPAVRGNILSSDGRVMVATLPEYRLLIDFVVTDKDSLQRAETQHFRDSVYANCLDSITQGLEAIFHDNGKNKKYDAAWFKNRLEEGKKRGKNGWRILPGYVTYIQYLACKELPLLRESPFKGGFHTETYFHRKKMYGTLASRTLGDLYPDSDAAKSGLECCYDTILRGRNGIGHRSRVRKNWLKFTDVEPQNGHDIVSTIDINIQDIVEKALLNQLKSIDGAEKGVAIVMEVSTGDVKAMASLSHEKDSLRGINGFFETYNLAINALWEPGSTFKTGSIMVAMEDHPELTPETTFDCEGGVWDIHGRQMKDHNWTDGGYGTLSVTQILGYSSNIGVSKIINTYYKDCPEKYVQGLYNIGVGIPLGMPMGADPILRMPKKSSSGKGYTNWSKTDLQWMSIGYVSQMPPISTLTFYNAIANNGKMVRPRFVKAELDNGQTVQEFPVVVLKEKICSDRTLHNVQEMLEKVVSQGLAKRAGNKKFKVSGKTGTAQVAEKGSYASHKYMVSFCGYFPSDAPKYSCIVCIYKKGRPASGGFQAGPVFREISQFVMNQGEELTAKNASDSTSVFIPMVAAGNMQETKDLLQLMKMPWNEEGDKQSPWGKVVMDSTKTKIRIIHQQANEQTVPDVTGMGARDAVFALQSAGMKVRTRGIGKVKEQSIPAGTRNPNGRTITINLN